MFRVRQQQYTGFFTIEQKKGNRWIVLAETSDFTEAEALFEKLRNKEITHDRIRRENHARDA